MAIDAPLVSVIIPCHNYAHYLGDAVLSVLNQTYKKVEVIVIDDESSDQTSQVSKLYPVVAYHRITHQGAKTPAHAHNIGISLAKGEFIIFLGADDKLRSDYVLKCLNRYFSNVENVGFVWSGCQEFEGSKRFREPHKAKLQGRFAGFINPGGQLGAMLVPKSVYMKVGGYDESLNGLEDWDWVIRCLQMGFCGLSIPDAVHYARVHDGTVTSQVKKYDVLKELYSKHSAMKVISYIQRGSAFSKHVLTNPRYALLRLKQ